jgi:hypothetical protein
MFLVASSRVGEFRWCMGKPAMACRSVSEWLAVSGVLVLANKLIASVCPAEGLSSHTSSAAVTHYAGCAGRLMRCTGTTVWSWRGC